ncbi:MAG: beta-hydroxyacyl-ACP dehydratase [Sedimentisphaerales bacterium]|nr:beta-hydroxyacyl-ACP dehydratase [Sedimentisphaerales bacterium]
MRWIWIDKFVEFEPGVRAVAVKNVTMAEEHLHDHFPGYPTMPAALMIEAMAQTAGILVGQARNFQEKVILAKVNQALFHEIVRPGDQLFLEARMENITAEAATTRGTIRCEDRLIAEITLMFSHIDQNLSGMQFPEENFVFNAQFMDLLKCYIPSAAPLKQDL